MSQVTRRALLKALCVGASGCFMIPSKPGPKIFHSSYPLGPIPRPRFGRPRGGLIAGASAVDITPPEGARVWLAGYGFQRLMDKVHDRIFARCLYLDDGERRVALVMADVVGLLYPTVQRVRKLVGNGIDVAVASTHNHQSPDTMGYWGPALLYALPTETGIDLAYQRVFERRLALSVQKASAAARPADIYLARAQVPKGLFKNLRTPGFFDEAIEVLEARGQADGKTLAMFVNLGCHPETLGDRARLLSADFPGPLCEKLQAERGGTAVFANGALGGMITPNIEGSADTRARLAFVQRMATELAEVTNAALQRAAPTKIEAVRYQRAKVELPTDNALFEYIERVGLIEQRRGAGKNFVTEVGRINLGAAAWALVPGEPSPKVGLRIKAALQKRGAQHPAVIALSNDELGYVLDPQEYDDPKFAYERSVSPGRETATILERALATL